MQYLLLVLAAMFIAIVWKSNVVGKRERLRNVGAMNDEYEQLDKIISACDDYDNLQLLEELVDDFYNHFLGYVPKEELKTKSDRLYNDLSAKGIELCAHPSM